MKLNNVKIIKVLPIQTGTSKDGKDWKKQEIVIEVAGEYTKKVCMALWEDTFTNIVKEGVNVDVEFDIESREYNSKWYTDCKIWKMNITSTEVTGNGNIYAKDIPSGDFPPPPTIDDAPEEKEENDETADLPF